MPGDSCVEFGAPNRDISGDQKEPSEFLEKVKDRLPGRAGRPEKPQDPVPSINAATSEQAARVQDVRGGLKEEASGKAEEKRRRRETCIDYLQRTGLLGVTSREEAIELMTRYPKEVEKNFNQREGYLASLQDKKIVSTREEAEDRARRGFALIDRALTALPEVKPKGIQEKLFGENAVRRREREEQEKDREYEDRRRQEEASSDAMLPPEEQERLRLARLTSQRAVGLHLLLNTVHLLRSETALLGGRPPSKEDLLREEYHERYTRKYRKMREEVDDYRARVEDYRDKGQQRTQGIRTSK